MTEDRQDQNLDKYLNDIETIKDLPAEVDKRPLYEPWVFYAWGGLVAIGSLIHFLVERRFDLPVGEIFLKVWLPVILLAGFSEVLALSRNLARHSLSLIVGCVFAISLITAGFNAGRMEKKGN